MTPDPRCVATQRCGHNCARLLAQGVSEPCLSFKQRITNSCKRRLSAKKVKAVCNTNVSIVRALCLLSYLFCMCHAAMGSAEFKCTDIPGLAEVGFAGKRACGTMQSITSVQAPSRLS